MRKTKIINTFHNTVYNSKRSIVELREIHRKIYQNELVPAADRKALYRITNALCGVKDCICGNDWGERSK